MNNCTFMGRLTSDPDVRYSDVKGNSTCFARYRLAVDRMYRVEGQPNADFIPCLAIKKYGEFAEKYFRKGMRVTVKGHIQTGSYDDKDGKKIYTWELVIEGQEFADGKPPVSSSEADDFIPMDDIPDNPDLPFQ